MKLTLTLLTVMLAEALLAGDSKDTVFLSQVMKVENLKSNILGDASPFTDLKYKAGERLSDALGEFSSIYVKAYGSGGLATIAVRGTSAEETEIQWNGMRLNVPSLGQLDLSLFLIGMQDELQLIGTGYQGTIGGTLQLNNDGHIKPGVSVNAVFRAGSFNTYNAFAGVACGTSKFWGATKLCYLTSANNFLYKNSYLGPDTFVRQTHAQTRQLSAYQELGGALNAKNEVDFYLWYTGADRQIPPLMSQPTDKQNQQDGSLRLMADWKGNFNKLKLKFTSAWMEDKIHYVDSNANIYETDIDYALRNKLTATYLFPFNLVLNGELNYDHEQVNITEYGGIKSSEIAGIRTYADYYLHNSLKFHLGFREDLMNTRPSAFAPEAAINYTPKISESNSILAGISASRNFRFPTMNELYWNPGGNPNLQEEKSVNGEIRLRCAYKSIADFSITNFYSYINNWIQWVPDGANWAAQNFREVFSKGIELSAHAASTNTPNPHKFTARFSVSYTYTQTTNLEAFSVTDQSKGKQLIYVPFHNLTTGVQLEYYRFYLRSVNTYTGPVFITTDNSQSLPGYFIPNLEAGKDFVINNIEFGFSFRVNNIGNLQYQAYTERPMPGRNFEGCFRFNFSKG